MEHPCGTYMDSVACEKNSRSPWLNAQVISMTLDIHNLNIYIYVYV